MGENIEKLLNTKRLTAIVAVGSVVFVLLVMATEQSFNDVFKRLWGFLSEYHRVKVLLCPWCA